MIEGYDKQFICLSPLTPKSYLPKHKLLWLLWCGWLRRHHTTIIIFKMETEQIFKIITTDGINQDELLGCLEDTINKQILEVEEIKEK